MKVLKVYDYNRRDCTCDLECEGCGTLKTRSAYDDSYFWSEVIPCEKCPNCGKTSRDFGINNADVATRHPDNMQL